MSGDSLQSVLLRSQAGLGYWSDKFGLDGLWRTSRWFSERHINNCQTQLRPPNIE
jgi:hypothetical protein